jgi:hypothetical protein
MSISNIRECEYVKIYILRGADEHPGAVPYCGTRKFTHTRTDCKNISSYVQLMSQGADAPEPLRPSHISTTQTYNLLSTSMFTNSYGVLMRPMRSDSLSYTVIFYSVRVYILKSYLQIKIRRSDLDGCERTTTHFSTRHIANTVGQVSVIDVRRGIRERTLLFRPFSTQSTLGQVSVSATGGGGC